MNRQQFAAAFAAIFTLTSALIPTADAQTNVFASSSSDVVTFQLGGPTDGSSHGSFISGISPSSPYRRIVFGGTNNYLYVGTDSDAIRAFDGTSGLFHHTLGGTLTGLRQLAVDPSNLDLYYTGSGSRIGRRAANEAAKPGTGQSGDTFVPVTSAGTVIVGPDLKVYTVDTGVLQRYSTAGGTMENSIGGFGVMGEVNFGPDITGDGKAELYLSSVSLNSIQVVDVLSNPSSWTVLASAVTGLSTPVGFAFHDYSMYIAENAAGRISRYTLVGTSWFALPSVGNSGATFATLADVQDVFIGIPEPSAMALLIMSTLLCLRRRVAR